MELKPGFRARGVATLSPGRFSLALALAREKRPGLGVGGGSLLIRWRIRGGYA